MDFLNKFLMSTFATEEVPSVPVVESFLGNNGGSEALADLTCNKPAGVEIGDLLVLICTNEDSGDDAEFLDTKDGWACIGDGGDSSSDSHIGVYWRVATGSEGASETVTANSADQWTMFYVRISGANTITPINISAFSQSSSSQYTHNCPSVETDVDNCLVLYGLSFDGSDGHPFSVSGTGWVQKDQQDCGGTYSYNSSCWGARDLASKGASGEAAVLCDESDGAAYFQVAINSATIRGVNSLAVNPIINSTARFPEARYKLGDANATNLVAWDYGATLVRQIVGVAPTYNNGAPPGDNWDTNTDGCLFNASDFYQCADNTTGDIADEDFFWELICYFANGGTLRMIDKRVASNEGYSILKSTDKIRFLIEDAPNNTISMYSPTISEGYHHFCGYGNRDEASAHGSVTYADGIAGPGVDISSIGSLTNNKELTAGATVDGAGNYDEAVMCFAIWKAADMIQAGATGKTEMDALALARSNLFWGV